MRPARLEVDPIRCEGHGLCAELLPELISLDDWGYPVIDGRPVPAELLRLARRAADACPTLALRLAAVPEPPSFSVMPVVESVRPGGEVRQQRDRDHRSGHQR